MPVQLHGSLRVAVAVGIVLGGIGSPLVGQIAELQIAPTLVELQAGETRTVVVTGYDAAGNTIPGVQFAVAGGSGVANVRRDPSTPSFLLIEGLAEGRSTITVASGSVTAALSVVVTGGGRGGTGPAAPESSRCPWIGGKADWCRGEQRGSVPCRT